MKLPGPAVRCAALELPCREILGTVVVAGANGAEWLKRTIIVSAVIVKGVHVSMASRLVRLLKASWETGETRWRS
ncbi:MAG: hypothetical protein GY789_08825 [Hyphomicrobiales bacterium]|nr:hypothetical protein [Hyphomicrobiales bacterium]MCP4998838.1 hypothetical protein [Hyphomicrobiales bacterium]